MVPAVMNLANAPRIWQRTGPQKGAAAAETAPETDPAAADIPADIAESQSQSHMPTRRLGDSAERWARVPVRVCQSASGRFCCEAKGMATSEAHAELGCQASGRACGGPGGETAGVVAAVVGDGGSVVCGEAGNAVVWGALDRVLGGEGAAGGVFGAAGERVRGEPSGQSGDGVVRGLGSALCAEASSEVRREGGVSESMRRELRRRSWWRRGFSEGLD